MRVLITLCALFCFAATAQANSSASTSYETHTVTTWGAAESGGSHGEMRRGQQRRADRKARRAAKGSHGSVSYAAPVSYGSSGQLSYTPVMAPVAAEVACEACAVVAAPVYVAAAPVYVPRVRVRVLRRPVAIVAAPLCLTGQCPTQ